MAEKKSKKKVTKNKKDSSNKEEVNEIFEVEDKSGAEKIVKTKGQVEKKHASKRQIAKQNNQLKWILIFLGIVVLVIVAGFFAVKMIRNMHYENVNFEVVKEGELILYKTSLPVVYQGNHVPYNFYLRKNPKDLARIEFDGDLNILQNAVLNMTGDFNCDGDGVIAVANLLKLYEIAGVNVIADKNASCDENGNYMYINILPGEKTKVEQFGPACYNIYIKDCEILEGTERFMLETFVEVNKIL